MMIKHLPVSFIFNLVTVQNFSQNMVRGETKFLKWQNADLC